MIRTPKLLACARELYAMFERMTDKIYPPAIAATAIYDRLGMGIRYSNKTLFTAKKLLHIRSDIAHTGNTKNFDHDYPIIIVENKVSRRLKTSLLLNDEGKHFYVWYLPRATMFGSARLYALGDFKGRMRELEEAQRKIQGTRGMYKKDDTPIRALAETMRALHYDATFEEVQDMYPIVVASIRDRPVGVPLMRRAKKILGVESVKRGKFGAGDWYWVWGAPEIVDWLKSNIANVPIDRRTLIQQAAKKGWSQAVLLSALRRSDIEVVSMRGEDGKIRTHWVRSQEAEDVSEIRVPVKDKRNHIEQQYDNRKKVKAIARRMVNETRIHKKKRHEERIAAQKKKAPAIQKKDKSMDIYV